MQILGRSLDIPLRCRYVWCVGGELDALVGRIEAARLERLMSKTALAALAGVSRQRVSGLLNGQNRSLSTLRAIRNALWPNERSVDAPR